MAAAAAIKAIPAGMAKATGIPLALGTQLLLQGQVVKKGVLGPETAFGATEFFQRLAGFCTFPKPLPAAELIEVTVTAARQTD